MTEYKIAAIPGDGIGKEVLPEGLKVLQAAAERTGTFQLAVEYFPWGCEHYLETGVVMAEDGIDTLRGFDVVYFGAGGHPKVPDYLSAWKLIFVIRHAFDQYVNLRPIKLLPGVATPLTNVKPEDIDDLGIITLSRDVAKKVEESLQYPGQIKVTVIREMRAVDYAK